MTKPLDTIAKEALDKSDPVACMHMEYEQEVSTIAEILKPALAASKDFSFYLSPQLLSQYITKALDTQRDLNEVLREALEVFTANPAWN